MNETRAASFATAATPPESERPVAVIVVHGIGDQVCNATVQQVVAQFSRHYEVHEPVALGAFESGPFERKFTTPGGTDRRFYFSEVYWADIPREVASKGYTLEETKQWASVIVEKLKPLDKAKLGDDSGVNFPLVQQVIGEMVETIGVLERLTFLAEKAGLAKFDLNKVLVDYLDDVQLVAEFQVRREEILAKFSKTLSKVDDNAEIYIVAHSEGTVVSFLGLLHAMWAEKTPPWLKQVRGYLTIGSPIDKHLVLWRDLFPWKTPPVFNPAKPKTPEENDPRIKWRNYYDYGDPVGFELDYTRKWLRDPDRQVTAFEFEGKEDRQPDAQAQGAGGPGHDIGFARYYLPGKAHNDYWTDTDVFDHFIEAVVKKSKTPRQLTPRPGVRLVAYLVSYGLPVLLLLAGVFFVLRCVASFNAEATGGEALSGLEIMRDAAGIASLLAGMTVLARMPRLASPHLSMKWLWIALGIFVLSAVGFWQLTGDETITAMGKLPELLMQLGGWNPTNEIVALKWSLGTFAFTVAAGSAWAGRKFVGSMPGGWSCGSKPLILLGGATAVGMVLVLLQGAGSGKPSLWPVLLALGGFLYLWWLAILLFDLIFVWHRYIRHGVANQHLECAAARLEVKAKNTRMSPS